MKTNLSAVPMHCLCWLGKFSLHFFNGLLCLIVISNTNFKARNLTNELNIKDLVTYFSSDQFFKLTESFLILLHGVRDLKILFKTLYIFKLKLSYWVSFAISKMGSAIFWAQLIKKLLAKTFFSRNYERFSDYCHESSPLVLSFKMQHINSRCH